MGFFDKNDDGKVTWAEGLFAVEQVKEYERARSGIDDSGTPLTCRKVLMGCLACIAVIIGFFVVGFLAVSLILRLLGY